MEFTLMLSQIIFYFVVSLAVIVVGVLFSMITYQLLYITKELKAITENVHHLTDEASERVNEIIEHLSRIPFFSFFLKRGRRAAKKVREEKSE